MPASHSRSAPICPICKAAAVPPDDSAFPFCSKRCQLIDLSRWMDGSYSASRPFNPGDPAPADETASDELPPDEAAP